MLLPPPKPVMDPADDAAVLAYIDGAVMKAAQRAQLRMERARRNHNLYLGNHWITVAPDESARYAFNRIKSIIMAHAAIQMGQRPDVSFAPRQSGEYGQCYVNLHELGSLPQSPDINAIVQQLQTTCPECLAYGPNGEMPQPLPRDMAQFIKQAIEQGEILTQQAQARGLPSPPVLPADFLVEINDQTATDALQIVFDAKWDECNADFFVLENAFLNSVIGWQHILYEWDDDTNNHVLFNPEFTNVFVDPTRTDISIAAYAAIDHYMTADEGAARYPELADVIYANSQEGVPAPAGSYTYNPVTVYTFNAGGPNMTILRTMWVRFQPYPMDAEEALEKGLITQGQAPIAPQLAPEPPPQTGPTTVKIGDQEVPSVADSSDEQFEGSGGKVDEASAETNEGEQAAVGDGGGADTGAPVQPAPAMRAAYFGPNGQEVQPWGPGWPLCSGIREIQVIAGKRVKDQQTEFEDIPLPHNVNYPIPHSPLGQGTPEDLEDMQMAINEMLSDLVQQFFTGSFPTQVIPESVHAKLPELARDLYVKPGTRLVSPDDLFREMKGQLVANQIPPGMSPDSWKILQQFLDLIDKQGEMAQVLQGQAALGWSGDAIGKLQSAAQGSILYRAKRIEIMLKYMAKLMVGGILRMKPEDLAKCIRKYPIYVWYALHDWMKNKLVFDITVEITSGGGAAKAAKASQTIDAAQKGVPVSPQSQLQALGKDPDTELEQIGQWQRKLQAQQIQTGAPAVGAPETQEAPTAAH